MKLKRKLENILKANLIFFSLILFSLNSKSQVYIDVGQATVKRSLLALPPLQFFSTDQANSENIKIGQEFYNVIYNDLLVTSYFTFIRHEAYLEDPAKVGLRPAPSEKNGFNYQNWRSIGTEFLIRAGYRVTGSKVSLETYLYHVPQAKLILGKTYEGPKDAVRKIAHTFCNEIMEALTKKKGMFLSKVVSSVSLKGNLNKEIYVMDWDGEQRKKISNHKSVTVSPAWSPDGKKIAYTAFEMHKKAKTRNPDMFFYELETGKRWLISYRKGLNSGAAFLPNGNSLLLTLSSKGNPDIYEMSLDGKNITQITRGPNRAMNVEPAPSPDGKKIAFSSDRSGKPMIYLMNKDGSNVQRLTFAGRYNASPSWSPDGKLIAFAGYDKTHFDIFTVDVNTKQLTRITKATKANGKEADNEDPSFSPDGRHIMYVSNRTVNNQIYISNLDGLNERRITVDDDSYFKPKWSGYIE